MKEVNENIKNEITRRREDLKKASESFEEVSKQITMDNGIKEIVPLEGKELDFYSLGRTLTSTDLKYRLTSAFFEFDVEPGYVNLSINRVLKELSKLDEYEKVTEANIIPDFVEPNSEKYFIDIMGTMIECPSEMKFQEYFELYTEGLKEAIQNGKISKDDLNPSLYNKTSSKGK